MSQESEKLTEGSATTKRRRCQTCPCKKNTRDAKTIVHKSPTEVPNESRIVTGKALCAIVSVGDPERL